MRRTSESVVERGPVPLHVLTGFLGSGKTTLLARLLERADEPLAVLVNEVGALALDPWLVERVDEDVFALPSGCLCCELRGELYAALARLAAHRPARVVLETSGLTDPAPILHGLATDPRLAAVARPAGVVAVVDAARAEDLLATQPEARRQLELADRVVLTKTDLAPWREAPVRALLAEAAPGCEVRAALHGELDPAWLLAPAALGGLRSAADARAWLHRPLAGERREAEPADDLLVRTGDGRAGGSSVRTIELADPVALEPLRLWLSLMVQVDGPRLLRVKLLARERASGEVFALQSAGRLVSPPRRLAVRPDGLEGLRGVLVARGLSPAELDRLVASLASAARGQPAPARAR